MDNSMSNNKILLIILALIIPPLAVFLKDGSKITNRFWIDLVLWLVTWIGGILYGLYVVLM